MGGAVSSAPPISFYAIISPMQPILEEKKIFWFFEVGIWLKGLNALTEIIGGLLILLINKTSIILFALKITQNELSDDPKDFVANFIVNSISNFSSGSQIFFSTYLLLHGLVKIFLVINLLKNRLWAYPASVVGFGFFIIYQIYRYSFTHSVWLLALTVFDIIVVALIWHEYRLRKRRIYTKL